MLVESCKSQLPTANIVGMGKGQKSKKSKWEVPKTFLKEWRESLELTQEQVSDLTGYTQATISRLELGRNFTGENLAAFASAYKCGVIDLFTPPERPKTEMDRFLAALGERQKARAFRLLKAIADEDAA